MDAQEAAKSDSLKAVAMGKRDSLETLARAKESEAFRPENMQADLQALFAKLVTDSPGTTVSTIAVLPFSVKGSAVPAEAGTMAAEFGVVFFTQRPDYKVVEREAFAKVAGEIALSQTGMVPDEETLEAGKVMAASLLVTGTVGETMGRRLISVRLIRTETGEVLAAAAASMTDKEMGTFYKDALGEKLSPASYAFRSVAVPGWGQFYSGHPGHGVVSSLAFVGAAGALAWSVYDYMEKDDEATLYKDHDNSTVRSGESADDYEKRANKVIDAKNDASFRTNILIGAVAGVWVLNILDAAILGRAESRKVKARYFAPVPQVGKGINGTACGVALAVSLPRSKGNR